MAGAERSAAPELENWGGAELCPSHPTGRFVLLFALHHVCYHIGQFTGPCRGSNEMPALYEQFGIHFEYPDNWVLDASEDQSSPASITVTSSSGAFWSISIHPVDEDLDTVVDQVLAALRDVYQDLDVEVISQDFGPWESIGYDVNFYCLDLISCAMIRAVHTPQGTYVVLCQAEDQDYQRFEPVFLAITTSLLRGAAAGSMNR